MSYVNGAGGAAAVTPPYIGLLLTDPRVGCVMNDTSDQGAKLQAAFDLGSASQKDSCIICPPGWVKSRQQLEHPTNRCIRIMGMGGSDRHSSSVSGIYWDVDLGAGKWAINMTPGAYRYRIDDIVLEGPGIVPVAGQMPCAMGGVRNPMGGEMNRVRITSFGSGVGVQNDHQEWNSCDFRGNGIAMDFMENGCGGLGDLVINRCFLTDCSRASIGVSSTNTIANLVATQGHAGTSPFGVWRYASPGTAATGSAASPTLTAVGMDWTGPADGTIIEGVNIPPGTTLLSHTGTPGNYNFVLSATPTGPVTNIVIGRRGTAMIGDIFTNWSWEGCHHAVFYDDYGVQSGNWGSWGQLTFTTKDSATFGWFTWQQTAAATGTNGVSSLSAVAVTNFTPTKGMVVTGTNVGANAKITAVTGTSGNYGLTLDTPNTGTVTSVVVRHPLDLAVYEVGDALNWSFINGTGCPGYVGHPAIRANALKYIHFDDAEGIRNNIVDAPTTVRPFAIRTAYNASGTECVGLTFGTGGAGGGLELTAQVCDEALAAGELVELNNLTHVRKSQATRKAWGHVVGSWSQGEVAVFIATCMTSSFSKVKNTSGVTINNGDLLKPHSGGGVQKATSMTDVPVTGQASETFTNGTLGQVYANYK